MSRSIHDTHRALHRILRDDYADSDLRRALAREVRGNIRRQRWIKEQVREQRARDERLPLPVFDPDLTPVLVEDRGPFVHHSATEGDVRELLRRMPPGMLDGLGPIRLCLGEKTIRDEQGPEEFERPDPYTGRFGEELLPGVFVPALRGLYSIRDCGVVIHAHVHEVGAPGPLAIHLKLIALATLVHEAAHHYDRMFRVASDRWRMDAEVKNERYARTRALELVETCVVPYLEERYPDECAAFRRWEAQHVGHALPLAVYTDDRERAFDLGAALERLARAVAAGEDPYRRRLHFVRALVLFERWEDARQLLAGLLAERPDDVDALTLQAYCADGSAQHDLAESLCRAVLARRSAPPSAGRLLARLLRRQARWEELATHVTGTLARDPEREPDAELLGLRARALVELDRLDAAADDIAALRAAGDAERRDADVVDALLLCRRGAWNRAFMAAQRVLRAPRSKHEDEPVEALAVRLESALQLGWSAQVAPLADAEVADLRACGRGAWIDRLLADQAAERSRGGS